MSLPLEVTIIVLLTMLNGLFSGAEIALLSVRKTRLRELAEGGNTHARAALLLRSDPERMMATTQIGITVIGASTAVFGGDRLEEPIVALLTAMGLGEWANEVSFVVVVVVISYLSLVLGELVPKSIALHAPERFTMIVARGLAWLARLSKPAVWLLTRTSNLFLRPFRDRTTFSESRLSPDELQQLVEESAGAGVLHPMAGEIASRAIDLGKIRANALMTPRVRVASIDVHGTPNEIATTLREEPHSRYPVFEHDDESILGYVLARDIYEAMARGPTINLRAILRPVSYFPETTPAIEVLRSLQAAKKQFGLLVDEQGALAGIITIEDIVEDLFGEILEEHETPRPMAWREPETGAVIALGEAPLHEVSRLLDEELTCPANSATIAGLVIEMAGRFPAIGERVALRPGVQAEVLDASPRQLTKVRLVAAPADSDQDEATAS